MKKILGYELRRMLLSKFYLALLLILGIYSWQVLTGDTILGVANTAPYSAWSFGAFLAKLLPLLLLTLLFGITMLYGGPAQQVAVLTDSTPFDKRQYLAIRALAAAIAYLIACFVVVLVGFWFMWHYFRFTSFAGYLVPIAITVLPAMLLVLGLGLLAGRKHVAIVYGLMLLLLVTSQLSLPPWLDYSGLRFFAEYPKSLLAGLDGERAFLVPQAVWIGKMLITLLGAGCTALAIGLEGKKHKA